ncbi:hypothetical protein BU24DRAFT_492692 [Aaosphaeria arxii CBS 175.79]|uniref:Rhodopsin domain-containing protein n=1 Tax=Aaosphaeria arxii CBS 175.79 TaxID=1450172 RepID=A0A6A5XTK9_9PLEO|nr:uncharacterized protein BU24DRAFT_492692 [Aaosphaeria arxii CBS 175.79]KAF2016638.1 hypothetical protein BU24DRAFT_492692 [Aaosphaeria arxii CBS 175.79]
MDQFTPEQISQLKEENLGPMSIAIVVSFTILSSICVALRFFTRIKLVRELGLEDWFILVSMCLSICMAACQVMQAKWGNGRHMIFLDLTAAVMILKYLYFSILTYTASLTFTKLSILLQYRRIFAVQKMRLPIYIAMGICAAYGITSVFTGIFDCVPVDAFWDLTKKPTARCVNETTLWYSNAGLNIATDLLVAILPIKAIWDLQLPKKQKIALVFILTIGWFVCVVSILRLHALVELAQNPQDTTWYSTATAYWSAIEVNLGIVCASTPALKALVVKFVPAMLSKSFSTGRSRSRSRSGTDPAKNRKSFIELSDKELASSSQGSDHYEPANPITALPAVVGGGQRDMRYEIRSSPYGENQDRLSDSESQKDLVERPEAFRSR